IHRYDRLRREIYDERDLLLGKRPHFLASGDDLPEQGVIFAQRHEEDCPDAAEDDPASASHRIVDFRQIRAMGDALAFKQTAAWMIRPWAVALSQPLRHWFRKAAHCHPAELLAIPELKAATGGAAQRVRLCNDRVEDRREVAGG